MPKVILFNWGLQKGGEGLRLPLKGHNLLEIQALNPRSVKNAGGSMSRGKGEQSSAGFSWVLVER